MLIKDKFGNYINSQQIMSLYVTPDPSYSSCYVVGANNSSNTNIANFWNGALMTEAEAGGLLLQIAEILGFFDPAN